MNTVIETLNQWGTQLTGFALPMLAQSAVLMAVLFALDALLRQRVRATVRYAMWMLLLVKLLLPPGLISPTSVAYWMPQATPVKSLANHQAFTPAQPPADNPQKRTPIAVNKVQNTLSVRPTLKWAAITLLIWLAALAGLSLWVVWQIRTLLQILHHTTPAPAPVDAQLKSCCAQFGIKRAVQLRCTTALGSPAICGFFHPIILIPASLPEKLSESEMRTVLLHELAHFRRGDLWIGHLQILLQLFYWYNPLLWFANRAIQRVREQAVDEMVLVEMREQAAAYPETLLQVARLTLARPKFSLGLVGILEPAGGLKERLQHILRRPVPTTSRVGIRGLLLVTALALVALPMACKKNDTAGNTTQTGIRLVPLLNSPDADTNSPATGNSQILPLNPGLQRAAQELALAKAEKEKLSKFLRAEHPKLKKLDDEIAESTRIVEMYQHQSQDQLTNAAVTISPGWLERQDGNLTDERVKELEDKVAKDPEDMDARRALLRFYQFVGMRLGNTKELWQKQMLWIIEHHPEADVLSSSSYAPLTRFADGAAYEQGKTLWLKHIQDDPKNVVFLERAFDYLFLSDSSKAEELLKQALAIEPDNTRLEAKLSQFHYWKATKGGTDSETIPATRSVVVVGEVRLPNRIEVSKDNHFTLTKAILRAGGFTDFADQTKVQVMEWHTPRTGMQKLTINVEKILESSGSDSDIVLEPGDFVIVPEDKEKSARYILNLAMNLTPKVYLAGAVHTPGPQQIPNGETITVSKAILCAGGFTDFADQRKVRVTRKSQTPGGKQFVVNVADILEKGNTEGDLVLESGDLIYVPEKTIRY